MSATNHTQNYDLSQFVGGDIPSWLNDYNGDMSKIDAAIASVAQGSGDVAADVASLKSRMTSAEADIDAAESNISTLQSTTSTQGAAITQNANNITTTNNNVSALDTRVTALENQTGYDLDFTAFEGHATVSNGSVGTVYASGVDYGLNAEKKILVLTGYVFSYTMSLAQGDNVIATLSISDLPELASAKEILTGAVVLASDQNGTVATNLPSKIKINTDKTIDVIITAASPVGPCNGSVSFTGSLMFIA